MNKRFSLIAGLLVIASMLLASCGAGASSQGPTEISFMMWGAPEELAVWQAVVDDFQKANSNITVKVDVSDWDSYWTKLNTLIAGNTPTRRAAEPSALHRCQPRFPGWLLPANADRLQID